MAGATGRWTLLGGLRMKMSEAQLFPLLLFFEPGWRLKKKSHSWPTIPENATSTAVLDCKETPSWPHLK